MVVLNILNRLEWDKKIKHGAIVCRIEKERMNDLSIKYKNIKY